MLKLKLMRLLHLVSKEEYNTQRQILLIKKSKLFDKKWYLTEYPDVKKTGVDPLKHYVLYGWREGYNPSEYFNTQKYLANNKDVALSGVCPLTHYVKCGKKEGRYAYPLIKEKTIIIKQTKQEKKGVIYTCITGEYDELFQHHVYNKNFDYVCFTDNENLLKNKELNGWKIEPLRYKDSDNTRNARWHKTHPHLLFPDYKISLWIDGNIDVITDKIFTHIDTLDKSEDVIFAFKHPLRDCIYDEGDAVIMLRKDTATIVREEMQFLNNEKYPKHHGLFETGVLIRKHTNSKLIEAMELWWDMIAQYSKRDQLSFTYALWKKGLWISSFVCDDTSIESSGNFIIRKSTSHNSKNLFVNEAKTISIIIPVYNGLEDIKKLFESIEQADFSENVDVIIVDDCSKEETKTFLEEVAQNKRYKLYRNEKNSGFVKSCNVGFTKASGDIVILLNSDTIVPKTLENKILFCFNHKKYIGVASPISSDTGLWKLPVPDDKTVDDMDKIVEKSLKREYPDILCPEGFCFCIRKEVLKEIGYLDEIYGIGYCEETDFALRALNNGWKCVLIDNLFVYHKHHVSFGAEKRKAQIEKNSEILWSRWRKLYDHFAEKIDMKALVNEKTDAILANIKTQETDESANIVEYGNNITLYKEIEGRANRVSISSAASPSRLKIKINGSKNQIIIDSPIMMFDVNILIGSPTMPVNNSLVHIKKDFSCSGAMICIYHPNSTLKIGEDCMFSSGITIRLGELPHLLFDNKTGVCLNRAGNLTIGNHVWLGESSTILKNASIGDNSIVGFGSVVTKNFARYSNIMIAGNPAEMKKKNIHWERNRSKVSKESKFFACLPKFK